MSHFGYKTLNNIKKTIKLGTWLVKSVTKIPLRFWHLPLHESLHFSLTSLLLHCQLGTGCRNCYRQWCLFLRVGFMKFNHLHFRGVTIVLIPTLPLLMCAWGPVYPYGEGVFLSAVSFLQPFTASPGSSILISVHGNAANSALISVALESVQKTRSDASCFSSGLCCKPGVWVVHLVALFRGQGNMFRKFWDLSKVWLLDAKLELELRTWLLSWIPCGKFWGSGHIFLPQSSMLVLIQAHFDIVRPF